MSIQVLPDRQFFDSIEYHEDTQSLRVTATELSRFVDQDDELACMIGDAKLDLAEREGFSATRASEWIEDHCQISEDTLKKTITGKIKVTRTFLYKFTVGMKMTVDEANKYFELCGGPLYERCMADYICMKALKDKDDIEVFIKDFELHTGLKIRMRGRAR